MFFVDFYSADATDISYISIEMDTVILRDLKFDLAIGRDAWRRPAKPQPVLITLNIMPKKKFEAAALEDDVNLTLDYGKLYKNVSAAIKDKQYGNIQGFMIELASVIHDYKLLNIDIVQPKALLEATGGLHYHLRIDRSVPDNVDATWSVAIKQITCSCIIGVNPHERVHKQRLLFDVILGGVHSLDTSVDPQAMTDGAVHDMVTDIVEVCHWNCTAIPSETNVPFAASGGVVLPDSRGSGDRSSSDHHHGSSSANSHCPCRKAKCNRHNRDCCNPDHT